MSVLLPILSTQNVKIECQLFLGGHTCSIRRQTTTTYMKILTQLPKCYTECNKNQQSAHLVNNSLHFNECYQLGYCGLEEENI